MCDTEGERGQEMERKKEGKRESRRGRRERKRKVGVENRK